MTVSAWEPPTVKALVAGLTAMETTRNGATVTAVVAVLPDAVCVAVIVAFPAASAVTYPVLASTFAMAGADETKVDPKLTTNVESSLKVPVTVNACTPPISRLTGFGVTAMEVSSATLGASGSEG